MNKYKHNFLNLLNTKVLESAMSIKLDHAQSPEKNIEEHLVPTCL